MITAVMISIDDRDRGGGCGGGGGGGDKVGEVGLFSSCSLVFDPQWHIE